MIKEEFTLDKKEIRILVIEDNPGDVWLLKDMFRYSEQLHNDITFNINLAGTLHGGISLIKENNIDLILLDLSLPDSQGIETFTNLYSIAEEKPVVILTGSKDSDLALESLQLGAQDYIVKGEFDENILIRVIRYAIERKKLIEQLKKTKIEIQESEERRRAFMDASTDGYLLVDADLDIIEINETAIRDLRFDNREEAIGTNLLSAAKYLNKSERLAKYLEVLKSGEPIYLEEVIPALHEGARAFGMKVFKVGQWLGLIATDVTVRRKAEIEKEKLISELKEALSKVKMLSGFLPICANCKKIRDDHGYWQQVEEYIRDHSEVEFSHGVCPECKEELIGDYLKDDS